MWRRAGDWTWRTLRGFGPALAGLGMAFGALLPPDWPWKDAPAEETDADPFLAGPGPGHPERLVAGVPLTPVEQQLWRQLTER